LASGDKAMMREQLGAFQNQVQLLQQGVPKVKGQTPGGMSAAPKQTENADPLGIR
jgi:hypothetical protein